MKVSLLFLAVLSVALFLQTEHQGQASELSQLLEIEIEELKDEIEKRGKPRPPCAFSWKCKKSKRRRGHHFWGKRDGIFRRSTAFNSFGSDDMDDILNDNLNNEE
ncbi:hypothetical protein OS493_000295 [Desmophyllum pertusum]|uniref:Uncharacterized protein n=1 Tax=Desmophyllum pertusum TaxID=174260 RepID=A0A9X0DD84_9CNID|nr:hypothetical protein OS493_000295 [Desmophyllum pertusum]